jgi:predicted  nucleic acid-binding Zn-ribbon protein
MAKDWDSAVKEAQKILGKDGKIPKEPPNVAKAGKGFEKAFDEFNKARTELKAKLVATQDSVNALKDAASQFQDEIGGESFGLDKKNKDDMQKITDARKVLSDGIQSAMDVCDTNWKNLKQLDKHLVSISDYTPDK